MVSFLNHDSRVRENSEVVIIYPDYVGPGSEYVPSSTWIIPIVRAY